MHPSEKFDLMRIFWRAVMTDKYYVVAATSELEENGQMYVQLDSEEILLCRHEGKFYAVAYYCSHAEFALEGGTLANGCITCPYHGAEFSIVDGSVLAAPAFEPIKCYPVKVENDTVSIAV